MTNSEITAALLIIGDEILSGRTKDKNIGMLADHLTALGIRLREVRIVGDQEGAIVEAVNALRAKFSYVFTTGGIGPTHDDITAESIAKAFEVKIDIDPRAVALMEPEYKRRGLELTPARLRMARIPDGGELIHNSVSMAPGFIMGNVIVMAGVPAIMAAMFNDVAPTLTRGVKLFSKTLTLAHPEAEIAELFATHQELYPTVSMGSYPSFHDGKYKTELVLRATDSDHLQKVANELARKLAAKGLFAGPK